MKKIIAIVGESGSGKTTIALMADERKLLPTVVSYTTRPMRPGEADGREHWFVRPEDKPDDLFAYTVFGGNEYWTSVGQIEGMPDAFSYVVDEDGIRFLEDGLRRHGLGDFILYKIRFKRSCASVDAERSARDRGMFTLPDDSYDAVFVNDGTIEDLYAKFAEFVEILIS